MIAKRKPRDANNSLWTWQQWILVTDAQQEGVDIKENEKIHIMLKKISIFFSRSAINY
jgi:hypothetical protein